MASYGIVMAGLAAVFLILSIFQAALSSLSLVTLARFRENGAKGLAGRLVRDALEPRPSRLQVGVQLARQLCLIGAAVATARIAELLGFQHPLLDSLLAITLVFALGIEQLAGRALALIDPERAFRLTLPAAGLVHFPLLPLTIPLHKIQRWVRDRSPDERDTEEADEEDVRAFVAVGEEEGILEAEEGTLIESVLDFSDTLVREVMTPRTEMAALEESATIGELAAFAAKCRHSRIPIYRGSIDHVVGFVNTRDLFARWGQTETPNATEFLRPAHVVPSSKNVSELLRELQHSRQQLAIVVDEYGGTAGLVTIEDLLEELVGEIRDEHEPEDIIAHADGSRIVRGRLQVVRAGELFGVDLVGDGFETVGGLVEARLGHIPEIGETTTWRGIRFEVTDVDRRRVRRVRMSADPTLHEASTGASSHES